MYTILSNGELFDFSDPKPIPVEETVKTLSRIYRYTGKTRYNYSVAAHCCLVSDLIREFCFNGKETGLTAQYIMAGLLHDVEESITGDICGPYKSFFRVYPSTDHEAHYAVMEAVIRPLSTRVSLGRLHGPIVNAFDKAITVPEIEELFDNVSDEIRKGLLHRIDVPRPDEFLETAYRAVRSAKYWTPKDAEEEFMVRWKRLSAVLNETR